MGIGGVLGTEVVPEDRMPLVYVATLLGPFLGAWGAAWLGEGRAGLGALWRRITRWRASVGWYLLAVLLAPVAMVVTLVALGIPLSPPDAGMVPVGLFMGLVVGTFEEVGWTGVALPRLRRQLGVVPAGIVLGLGWGLWHLPLFAGSALTSEELAPTLYLAVLLFSFLVPFRTMMVWLHERTRSFWVVVLAHAPLAGGQLLLVPPDLSGTQMVRYDVGLAALLWVLVAVVASWRRAETSPVT